MAEQSQQPMADRPYHHGNLRESVLSATLEVLANRDPAAVSFRDLARKVGVRHSALYSHFRDRNDLLAVLASDGFKLLYADLVAVAGRATQRLTGLAERYIRFARAHPAYYKVMFLPEVSQPENIDRLEEVCKNCFNLLQEALRETPIVSDGEVHERAIAIWSTLHGLVVLGDDSGPLSRQVPSELEPRIASRIVMALASAQWPLDS